MSGPPRNISFDGRPVERQLVSAEIVLIDPLALDGLSTELQHVAAVPATERFQLLRKLPTALRIGAHLVPEFRPGAYAIGLDDFEPTGAGSADDAGVVDVDTGTLVVIDLAYLRRVARALSWDRYDALLQSPINDDSALRELISDVGGPFFALIGASATAAFDGDGEFRFRSGAPRPV